MNHVHFLHNYIGRTEWSGILLWKIEEGNLNDPDNLIIKCIDLFIMDIGSSAYTEFESDAESIIALSNQFPEYEDGNIMTGLIHSHHNMKTFFSGDDNEELQDNTEAYSAYLSLIVNFVMDNTARLAFIVENEIESKYSIKDFFGSLFNLSNKKTEKFIGYYDCEIIQEDGVEDWFVERTKQLEREKEAKKAASRTPYQNQNYGYPGYMQTYSQSHNGTKSKVTETVNLRSFICKVISLNQNYLGSDVKHAVSTANSKVLGNKNKDSKLIRVDYRRKVESIAGACLASTYGKNMSLEQIIEVFEDALDFLQDFSNYMVAQEFIHYLEETLNVLDSDIEQLVGEYGI